LWGRSEQGLDLHEQVTDTVMDLGLDGLLYIAAQAPMGSAFRGYGGDDPVEVVPTTSGT
jgi:hypothetical protein